MPNKIDSQTDLDQLIKKEPIVIITTYRGKWCPFCLKYLSDFNKAKPSLPKETLLVGISVDSSDECEKLKGKLKLDYDLISDEQLFMEKTFDIKTGRGHGKEAYLQPSVIIFKNGEKVFEWIQEPKFKNFGGAISRLPITDVLKHALEANNK